MTIALRCGCSLGRHGMRPVFFANGEGGRQLSQRATDNGRTPGRPYDQGPDDVVEVLNGLPIGDDVWRTVRVVRQS